MNKTNISLLVILLVFAASAVYCQSDDKNKALEELELANAHAADNPTAMQFINAEISAIKAAPTLNTSNYDINKNVGNSSLPHDEGSGRITQTMPIIDPGVSVYAPNTKCVLEFSIKDIYEGNIPFDKDGNIVWEKGQNIYTIKCDAETKITIPTINTPKFQEIPTKTDAMSKWVITISKEKPNLYGMVNITSFNTFEPMESLFEQNVDAYVSIGYLEGDNKFSWEDIIFDELHPDGFRQEMVGGPVTSLAYLFLNAKVANYQLTLSNKYASGYLNIKPSNKENRGEQIVENAEKWIDTDYDWGGNSKDGIDCSHLVNRALNDSGYKIDYEVVSDLVNDTKNFNQIADGSQLPGDIISFPKDDHVGIVKDANTFIGSQSSTGVAEASYTDGYWGNKTHIFLRPK